VFDPLGHEVGSSYDYGTSQPESFSMDVQSGKSYTLVVAGWEGGVGDWHVEFH
jgi:hypothetical protein